MSTVQHGGTSIGILAGGKSRRMGRDKALLSVRGQTLIERVISKAQFFSDDVFIVATDRPEYERFGVTVVPDRVPDSGSLGGIFTAVDHARHDACLVLACDMPFIQDRLLQYLIDFPRNYDVLIPALSQERSDQGKVETLETLHAIYRKSCIEAMGRRIRAGRLKIVGFFPDVNVERIPETEIRKVDPELRSFFNANTPEEFEVVLSEMSTDVQ